MTASLLIRRASQPDGRTGVDLLSAPFVLVVRGGTVVSRMARATAELNLPGRPARADFSRPVPALAPGGAG